MDNSMEQKGQHTPGPWIWHEDNYDDLRPLWWCEMSQGCGYLSWDNEEAKKANARLIAAAPDLLEALIVAARAMHGDTTPQGKANYSIIRAAIAKAKGTTV